MLLQQGELIIIATGSFLWVGELLFLMQWHVPVWLLLLSLTLDTVICVHVTLTICNDGVFSFFGCYIIEGDFSLCECHNNTLLWVGELLFECSNAFPGKFGCLLLLSLLILNMVTCVGLILTLCYGGNFSFFGCYINVLISACDIAVMLE